MKTLTLLMPLPHQDFDPTEVAVTWQILRSAGHRVVFATPDGQCAHADPLMLSGEGLDAWALIPGLRRLRLIGLMLRAERGAREAYARLEADADFATPLRYGDLRVDDFDGLLLSGGHAKGMRTYLEDKSLQAFVAAFFETRDSAGRHKPVAAICHGVLLAARSMSANTGRSSLHGRKTTALTWKLERSAWNLTRFWARFWEPTYYRTYSERRGEAPGHWSVESEIKRLLARPEDFVDVPPGTAHFFKKTSGLVRDSLSDDSAAWVVRDGNFVSARWPGDVHAYARRYLELLAEYHSGQA